MLGLKAGTVYSWVKKVSLARNLLQVAWEQRRGRSRGRALPTVISLSLAEMWSYTWTRHGEKRWECWVWTAVVEEPDGRKWVDYEVGERSEVTFL